MANPMESSEKPLRKMGEAFKELAATLNNNSTAELEVAPFSHACSLVSPLFGCLGIAFKFAEMDYVAKVHDLAGASGQIVTLNAILNRDVEAKTVKISGSHTRNLLRVKRGIDMVKVLFEQILVTEGNSLRDPASKAYAQVFAPFHNWAIRKAVAAGMYAIPTKAQLLGKLNVDESSAMVQMQNYITASAPVITNIEANLKKIFSHIDIPDWNSLFFIVHPGGPVILNKVKNALSLKEGKSRASYEVLGDYGNMGGPRVIFALDEMRKNAMKEGKPTTGDGLQWGVLVGPGVTPQSCYVVAPLSQVFESCLDDFHV